MAVSTKLYLDTRASLINAPLKIYVTKKREHAFLNLGIKLRTDQWDKKFLCVVNHPNAKSLNILIAKKKADIDMALLNMDTHDLTAIQIRDILGQMFFDTQEEKKKNGTFYDAYIQKINSMVNKRTQEIYKTTLKWIAKYDSEYMSLDFNDVSKKWLEGLNRFMLPRTPAKNARNIHFRNIRAVFNFAIDEGQTSFYPFRKFDMSTEPTKKRSLSIEELRLLFKCEATGEMKYARDVFMLMFFLIGINTVDLCLNAQIENGRIEYIRAKTKKNYSIKIEPEAMVIIKKIGGDGFVIARMKDRNNYRSFSQVIQKYLNRLCDKIGIRRISPYWSRHTWATIAAELDIPKETIAAALGHGGNTVTDIYIRFDQKKIDKANRQVIDYVLYGRK